MKSARFLDWLLDILDWRLEPHTRTGPPPRPWTMPPLPPRPSEPTHDERGHRLPIKPFPAAPPPPPLGYLRKAWPPMPKPIPPPARKP